MNPTCRCCLGALGIAAAAHTAAADAVSLDPVKDNTLFEHPLGALSNGAGQYIFTGMTGQPRIRRAVLAFDVAGAIPPGSVITGAALTLRMSKTVAGAFDVSLHRVLADWGEGASDAQLEEGEGAPAEPGDATWVHACFDVQEWGLVGGDFDPGPSATIPVDQNGFYTWGPTAGMIADVQAWLDNPGSNFGWIVIGEESQSATAKRFNSREHPDAETRPVLGIQFQAPCYPDFTGDGALDLFDFLQFVNEFNAQTDRADCTRDGGHDLFDFLCFVNEFNAGCG